MGWGQVFQSHEGATEREMDMGYHHWKVGLVLNHFLEVLFTLVNGES